MTQECDLATREYGVEHLQGCSATGQRAHSSQHSPNTEGYSTAASSSSSSGRDCEVSHSLTDALESGVRGQQEGDVSRHHSDYSVSTSASSTPTAGATTPPPPEVRCCSDGSGQETGRNESEQQPESQGGSGPNVQQEDQPNADTAQGNVEVDASAGQPGGYMTPMPCSEDRRQLIVALSRVYGHLACLGRRKQKRTKFHSEVVPRFSTLEYLTRIAAYFDCSDQCLLLSLVYIDRLMNMNPEVVVSPWSIHRILLTGVMVATKFWDDNYYSNAHYAQVGGVTTEECCGLEELFLKYLDWKLYVSEEEYSMYLRDVMAAVSNQDGSASAPIEATAEVSASSAAQPP
eukprot:CAMPEP_0206475920 /NCGR_PEP_ID=MMETSP0324_2-20121206/34383_1 /ASSEMBLY_ACC=CAM_ASM_000836 /TAXON_ID=2866 /ORGANISM="Crypthecodinium cohnii, Strain Seligo" /LENGTH=345 /DNA_ID=CAMNT_0053951403 /DNA_START=147 /DNA_END=1184 /DNA_ORIENTATION=-